MNQVQDRKKLRREYLDKKLEVYTKMTASAIGTLLAIAVLVLLATSFFDPKFYSFHMGSVLLFVVAATFLLAVVVKAGSARHSQIRHELDAIPYVPPVTPDILPDDEILIRGSEEPPVVQSQVLLRAAEGQETPKEELLRVSHE